VSTYGYDGFDRKSKLTYPDNTFEAWTYDANGNVLTFTTRNGDVITQTFDVLNRLSTRTPGTQPSVTYAYDLAGRLLSVSTPVVAGNPATGQFSRGYDTAGRLTSETNPQSQVVSYQLDANGNITKITHPDGWYATKSYDELNRLTAIALNGAGSNAAAFVYDALSRRTQLTYGNTVVTTDGYDIGNNRTSRSIAFTGAVGTVSWSFGFNKVHQMTSQTVSDKVNFEWVAPTGTTNYGTANNVNEYPTVGGITYSYNNDGCLANDGKWHYSYDIDNRLISAAPASGVGYSVLFDYDGDHRQIRKTYGFTKTKFVYSGSQLLEEWDDVANTLIRRYVYAHGSDDPVLLLNADGVVTYLHQNHIGSIIAQSDGTTGNATNIYRYSSFGEPSSLGGTTFGYTGQRYDSETGLYHYKARYYAPSIGRFLQTDPVWDLSLYAYVHNDPMDRTDPDGTSDWPMSQEEWDARQAKYGWVKDGLGVVRAGGSDRPLNAGGTFVLSDLTAKTVSVGNMMRAALADVSISQAKLTSGRTEGAAALPGAVGGVYILGNEKDPMDLYTGRTKSLYRRAGDWLRSPDKGDMVMKVALPAGTKEAQHGLEHIVLETLRAAGYNMRNKDPALSDRKENRDEILRAGWDALKKLGF